jgi:DNA-directed RNA polymerase specialized sigma24 family protein
MNSSTLDHVVQVYGDLLFDLCESVLWTPGQAQAAFRAIVLEAGKTKAREKYKDHERAWILRIAFKKLKQLSVQHARKVTASEQMELDAAPNVAIRLKKFGTYFHRLNAEQQIILLLKDKYGLPYIEVSNATGLPEGTLKGIRGQALRALEAWLWDDESPTS